MTPQRHALIKRVFAELIECPAGERSALLARHCGNDEALRREIERLLEHHQQGTLQLDELVALEITTALPGEGGSPGAAQPPGETLNPGTVVAGRYRIVAPLGEGGMGRVYRVEDLVLNQTVALKFLNPGMAANSAWLVRLRKEASLARTITHTNVCRVYDIGEADGVPFLSMEYVDGENLACLLRRIGRVPGDRAVEMAGQICAGLAAAHARGVLHRDLKPANVMIDGQGRVRLTDFGLAGFEHEIKGREILSGTPAYMAPEQISGQAVSVQSDLYSLGLVLYELFTGHRAFSADSPLGYADQHLKTRPAPPSRMVQNIDPQVEAIILRCLEKKPADRPESALAVAAALPGHDLLAAALAAGQVPSPEMVAAARLSAGGQFTSLVRLVTAALLLVLLIILRARSEMPWEAPGKHPAVLASEARQLIEAAGLKPAETTVHEAVGFCDADEVLGLAPAVRLTADQPPPAAADQRDQHLTTLAFWFRQSPQPLLPRDALNVVLGTAQVLPQDPAALFPGMVSVALDMSGRLQLLAAVPAPMLPAANLAPDSPQAPADPWAPLLAAARLDDGSLQPAIPDARSLFPADAAAAWSARLAGRPVRIEALALQGSPLLFTVYRTPEASPESMTGPTPAPWWRKWIATFMATDKNTRLLRTNLALLVLAAGMLFLAVPWAWQNYHAGRGDRQGALRLAVTFLGLRMLMWVLELREAPPAAMIYYLILELVDTLAITTVVWLYYIALEPHARRHWPHMLITWSRVLRLKFKDPAVGQHVLAGVTLGLTLALLVPLERTFVDAVGWPARPVLIPDLTVQNLLGGRLAMAGCLGILESSMIRALVYVLVLAALRSMLRLAWLAGVITALLLGVTLLTWAAHPLTGVVLFVLIGAGFTVWMTMRHGLVMLMTGLFVHRLLSSFPLGFSAWYDDLTCLALAIVIGLALYGFITGRREARPQAPRPLHPPIVSATP